MKNRAIALMMAAGVMTFAAGAYAQPKDAPKPAAPTPAAPIPVVAPAPAAAAAPAKAPMPRFADEEMTQVATALTGSWLCPKVPNAGAAGEAADVAMSVAPVSSKDLPNLLYAELARADALNRPYRQAVWQLHRVNGKLRLKTMEFRRVRGEMLSAAGLWAAPDQFPAIGSEDLVTTLDIELSKTKDGKGWTGKTPHSYPTSMGGAIEMTSEMTITPDSFTTSDQGFDASGKLAWGPDKAGGFTFKKFDPDVKVQHLPDGVVVIDFPAKTSGAAAQAGERVQLHYTGYLANGWMFDSSYERGTPLTHTVGGKYNFICEGFRRSLGDAKKGMLRKVVIPGPLGFGEAGELKGKIPANATLYIDMQILDVGPAVPTVPGAGLAPVGIQPGGNVIQPQPVDVNSPEFQAMMKKKQEAAEAAAKDGKPAPKK
jgi:hypothetical protein